MDAASAAALTALLEKGGPWAIVSLLIGGVTWALKGWMGSQEARVAETARLAAALERSSQTSAAVSAALESRSGRFERLEEKVEESTRAGGLSQAAITSKLDQVTSNQGTILSKLDAISAERRGRA